MTILHLENCSQTSPYSSQSSTGLDRKHGDISAPILANATYSSVCKCTGWQQQLLCLCLPFLYRRHRHQSPQSSEYVLTSESIYTQLCCLHWVICCQGSIKRGYCGMNDVCTFQNLFSVDDQGRRQSDDVSL